VASLLELVWDDDVDMLWARLGRDITSVEPPTVGPRPRRTCRVTERILASWHADSSLDRFVYRGLDLK